MVPREKLVKFLKKKYVHMKERMDQKRADKRLVLVDCSILPEEEFLSWALSHPEYNRLVAEWELSGYLNGLSPSIDRVDCLAGYTKENMQWLTKSENSHKSQTVDRARWEEYRKQKKKTAV